MNRFAVVGCVLALAGLTGTARADDAGQAGQAGAWKYELKFGGQAREFALNLKEEGGKLTGTVVGANGPGDILLLIGPSED
jgi:hypothetical protein